MKKAYDIAITVGVFDLLHEGHVNLLRKMAEAADEVVVFIHDDRSTFRNKGRYPVHATMRRYDTVKWTLEDIGMDSLRFMVGITYERDPGRDLVKWYDGKRTRADGEKKIVFMRGDDMPHFPGRHEVEGLGIPIEFVAYTKGVSTSERRANELPHAE